MAQHYDQPKKYKSVPPHEQLNDPENHPDANANAAACRNLRSKTVRKWIFLRESLTAIQRMQF
jgi:hypothetical protein